MRHLRAEWTVPHRLPGGWTILHRADPAMDLHLKLMAEAADEALRGVRASEEFCRRRAPSVAPDAARRTPTQLVRNVLRVVQARRAAKPGRLIPSP